jgi:hypothetical protein
MAEKYYYGQGRVHVASFGSAAYRWVGDVSALSIGFEVQNIDHFESYSGQKNRARRLALQTDGTVNITMHQMDRDNLVLALRGTGTDIPAITTATATHAIAAAAAGDIMFLPHIRINRGSGVTFTVVDANTTPLSLTENTHWTLDADTGKLTFVLVPTAAVFPLTVTYEYGAQDQLALLNTAAPVVSIVYEGINLAESNARSRVELYRLSMNPLEELQLINADAFGALTISAAMEADGTKPAGGTLGQMGRILEFAA